MQSEVTDRERRLANDLRVTTPEALPAYLHFWGKATPPSGAAMGWHPAVYHMLDVAACFDVLFEHCRPSWLDPAYKAHLLLLVALHDIGKITRSFQQQAPDYWPAALLGPFKKVARSNRHDTLGHDIIGSLLRYELEALLPESKYQLHWLPLVRATTGHHGKPPKGVGSPNLPPEDCCDTCQTHVRNIFKDFCDLFLGKNRGNAILDKAAPSEQVKRMHWWFAGIVNLADWIGSSSAWFPYTAPSMPLDRYYELARQRAEVACSQAGVLPAKSNRLLSFAELFGIPTPSPVQNWCATVPLPEGGKLVFIEDETGNGKTEAALMLAHRMMVAGDATGLFCAMPTMATANAMYDRCGKYFRRFFAAGTKPSLALAHGKKHLNEAFQLSLSRHLHQSVRDIEDGDLDEGDTTGVECATWIGSDNRRAFLADVGVGTIDQALLGVMRSKFGMLRLFGLSRRVLIIDEAHAYDSYMIEIIKRLLEFHARLGGSAIILSATLPLSMRNQLAAAFATGLGNTTLPPLTATGYPLATMVSASGVVEEHDALVAGTPRKRGRGPARVEVISDFESVLREIENAAQSHATVAWIRNTVRDATTAARILRERGLDVTLFHARFTAGDRADIETEVLAAFGKESSRPGRDGRVVVATQVIEQSLDLDFDLIVSDPAPVDLLIQRAGRLWRHIRDDRPLSEPRFIIAAPMPVDDPPSGWLEGMTEDDLTVAAARIIYRDAALLWRSVRITKGEGSIGSLDGIRRMVEAAYDKRSFGAYGKQFIPSGLESSAEWAATGDKKSTWMGQNAPLTYIGGYSGGQWEDDTLIQTRLGKPAVVARLAREENGKLVPFYPSERPGAAAWAMSEVTSSYVDLTHIEYEARVDALVRSAKRNWGSNDKRIPLIPLQAQPDGSWKAVVSFGTSDGETGDLLISYHQREGFFAKRT